MAIETLDDWNDRITSFGTVGCCECEVVGQDDIAFINESLDGFVEIQGWGDAGNIYLTKTVSYSGGGSSVQTYDSPYACSLGGTVIEAIGSITTVNTPPLTGTPTTSYSGLINVAAELAAGRAAVEAAVDWDNMTLGGASIGAYDGTFSDTYREIVFARLKFRKADFAMANPPGTYLKLTFDVIDYPEAGSDVSFATDEVLEWTGTFDVDDQTNAAHYTDFYYIDPPATEGTREIKNMRFTRFQSTRYGNKPQTSADFGTFP